MTGEIESFIGVSNSFSNAFFYIEIYGTTIFFLTTQYLEIWNNLIDPLEYYTGNHWHTLHLELTRGHDKENQFK